eukprot:m.52144 g.52144  ORF g.52144 m.52144 type:complete len:1852 (-) comp11758_c0_seq1:56-5611(-)
MSSLRRLLVTSAGIREVGQLRLLSTANQGERRVTIGDLSIKIRTPLHPELVPYGYASAKLLEDQIALRHLRWMMQKDQLKQDMFLIGPPGPQRARLALAYCELLEREVEYIALSRDTIEGDIKQRREIRGDTAVYIDQCAVRAAINGRVLILDGIEKAERNVLPILNNLLENREMHLEDGRFLVSPTRFDHLRATNTAAELERWRLVRVHDEFRVIALGLPVPRYPGHPLDPPLRSRFQARVVRPESYFSHLLPSGAPAAWEGVLSHAAAMRVLDTDPHYAGIAPPILGEEQLEKVFAVLSHAPDLSPARALHAVNPHLFFPERPASLVARSLAKFNLGEGPAPPLPPTTAATTASVAAPSASKSVSALPGRSADAIATSGQPYVLETTKAGAAADTVDVVLRNNATGSTTTFALAGHPDQVHPSTLVPIESQHRVLAEVLVGLSTGDLCLVGGRGVGKSALVDAAAARIGATCTHVMLHKDMTARDLLQQRVTEPNGDTAWRPAPLITAAVEGSIAVLDGVHRLDPGALSALRRLAHDRELHLPDGTRLVPAARLRAMCEEKGLSHPPPAALGYVPVHPAFRMVALGEPPGSQGPAWLTDETQTMLLTVPVPALALDEQRRILTAAAPRLAPATLDAIMRVATVFASHTAAQTAPTAALSLSLRQLLRLARRMQAHPGDCLYSNIERLCLARFLPRTARAALHTALDQAGLAPLPVAPEKSEFTLAATNATTSSTSTTSVSTEGSSVLVPQTLFYANAAHAAVLSDIFTDFELGEHLLLMGNQGVGKNKIVDHFLQTLHRPREYMQLHRDSTVQTLTQQTSVKDGAIMYEDSPLVRAALLGRVAVIDEADKAPPHVTCVLKTLVEHGSLQLADGRQIMPAHDPRGETPSLLRAHKDFRVIVLANRPGYPFLGHDFFASMGDIFSCHAVDNPGVAAELSMLQKYAPDVDVEILSRLTRAFNELRTMADEGQLTYPYSLRELVAISSHLQKFPEEGVERALQNVFAFDTYDANALQQITSVLHKHGVPIGSLGKVALAPEVPLSLTRVGGWQRNVIAQQCEVTTVKLSCKADGKASFHTVPTEVLDDRTRVFGEGQWRWSLPMLYSQSVTSIVPMQNDTAAVVLARPAALVCLGAPWTTARAADLSQWFPVMYRSPGIMQVAPMAAPNMLALFDGRVMFTINTETGVISRLGNISDRVTNFFSDDVARATMVPINGSRMASYVPGSQAVHVWDLDESSRTKITLPLPEDEGIASMHAAHNVLYLTTAPVAQLGPDNLGVKVTHRRVYELATAKGEAWPTQLHELTSALPLPWTTVLSGRAAPTTITRLHPELTATAADTPSVLLAGDPASAAHVAVTLPDGGALHRVDRHGIGHTSAVTSDALSSIVVRRPLTNGLGAGPAGSLFMEIVDLRNLSSRAIHLERTAQEEKTPSRLIQACFLGNGSLLTFDSHRTLRLWEIAPSILGASLDKWLRMVGSDGEGKRLRAEKTRYSGLGNEGPKHGKRDAKNDPHVGGNTWAGGTGGRDTAGLGGKGGPYRLDAGHDVHQLSREEKDAVPDHIKKAALEMGQQAFLERLREINMSQFDAEAYEAISSAVRTEVQQLRVLLSTLQAKGQERAWLRFQTAGDLDDGRIVEGLTGESNVFRRRGPPPPAMLGLPQEHPKRIEFILDVSGSMYRFNGHDGRLDRSVETACMLMEAFADAGPRFDFTIAGHSGDGPRFTLVEKGESPKNNKDRLKILQRAQAHAQFCVSGDHTLEAIQLAVARLGAQQADERVVIALSDANLDVYGISAARVAKTLTSDPRVSVFLILIGSLGQQAEELARALPPGRAFVCLDTKRIPGIVKQIFAASIQA